MSVTKGLIAHPAFGFLTGMPVVLAIVASLSMTASAHAETAPVVKNGGFDVDAVTSGFGSDIKGGNGNGMISDWSISGPSMWLVKNKADGGVWQSQNGMNSVSLMGDQTGTFNFPSIQQTVTGFVKGWTYSLNFWMSGSPSPSNVYGNVKTLAAYFSRPLNGIGTTSTQLFGFNIDKQLPGRPVPGITWENMGWEQKSMIFTYDGDPGPSSIGFYALANSDGYNNTGYTQGDNGPAIDNVSLSIVATSGPEAGAGLSMLASVIGLALWRRRRPMVVA